MNRKYLNTKKINNKIKEQKGSITLFVIVSMLFFLVVLAGIYVNSSNKIIKQEKEIKQIEQYYNQSENINDIYEKRYQEYKEEIIQYTNNTTV